MAMAACDIDDGGRKGEQIYMIYTRAEIERGAALRHAAAADGLKCACQHSAREEEAPARSVSLRLSPMPFALPRHDMMRDNAVVTLTAAAVAPPAAMPRSSFSRSLPTRTR